MSDYSAGCAKPSGALPESEQPRFGAWARPAKGDPWRLIAVGNDEAALRARLRAHCLDWFHCVTPRGTLPPGGRIFTPSARAEEDVIRNVG